MSAGPAPWLALHPDVQSALADAAVAAYPKEFCALLFGSDQIDTASPVSSGLRVTRVVFADNVDPNPERGFELDPAVLVRELRNLREADRNERGGGERLLGHAHSHPDVPARPSERDLASAFQPDQVWLIVPVRAGVAGRAEAYQLVQQVDGGAAFRPIRIVESAPENPIRRHAGGGQESP